MASSASSSSSSLDGASTPTIASLPLAALRPHARLCAGADVAVSPANAAPVKVRLLEAPDETLGETLGDKGRGREGRRQGMPKIVDG